MPKLHEVRLSIYEDDYIFLIKKYGDAWDVFIRDIINQHTTPYGADRRAALDELAKGYRKRNNNGTA